MVSQPTRQPKLAIPRIFIHPRGATIGPNSPPLPPSNPQTLSPVTPRSSIALPLATTIVTQSSHTLSVALWLSLVLSPHFPWTSQLNHHHHHPSQPPVTRSRSALWLALEPTTRPDKTRDGDRACEGDKTRALSLLLSVQPSSMIACPSPYGPRPRPRS